MMKNVFLALSLLAFQTVAFAGNCGDGKVIDMMEGGWNTNDLFIRIDYAGSRGEHPGTEYENAWIVFKKANLDVERFRGIKALALSSLLTGTRVIPFSHNNRCDNATEFRLLR